MLAARPEQAADIVDAQARARDLAPIEFVEIVIEPMKTEGMTASEEAVNIRPTLRD